MHMTLPVVTGSFRCRRAVRSAWQERERAGVKARGGGVGGLRRTFGGVGGIGVLGASVVQHVAQREQAPGAGQHRHQHTPVHATVVVEAPGVRLAGARFAHPHAARAGGWGLERRREQSRLRGARHGHGLVHAVVPRQRGKATRE